MAINVKKLLNQAEKEIKAGDLESAKSCFQTVLNSFPKNSKARLGIEKLKNKTHIRKKQSSLPSEQITRVLNLFNSGQVQEALITLKLLNNEYPNVPLIFNLMGACYKSMDQVEEALEMFETASNIKPDYAEAYFNQGVIYKGIGKTAEAIDQYKKAISIMPNYPDAYNNLGNAYKDLEMDSEAIESYEWSLAYKPENPIVHVNLGVIYSTFDPESALKHYQMAINIKPDYSEAYFQMGSLFRHLGNKTDSIFSYEKAIEINPDFIDAHKNLSAMKTYIKGDKQTQQMKSLLLNNDLSLQDQISLNFALAKVSEDLESKKDFFKYLNEGNNLRKQELNYSITLDKELFGKIKEVFDGYLFKVNKSNTKESALKPIFILGMPRSGTTLVEQIISSHHKVFGAGELEYISKHCINELKNHSRSKKDSFSNDSFLNIREEYLKSIENLNITKNIFTDKMPLNFRYVGFILAAFPEAKIVHLKRDAIATCWSIYKYYFKSDGNGYAHNFKDLASYFKLYKDLMSFWHKKFPNQIYDISYEKLTTNQESETRRLIDYCELDWDDNCINFHKNKRAVKTTSALQVRQEMYQGSSEAWKKYKTFLKPLIEELEAIR